MKSLLACIFLAAIAAQAQQVPSMASKPKGYHFNPNSRPLEKDPAEWYGKFTLTTGAYPLTGISSYPVAKFQYAYKSDAEGTKREYSDSLKLNTGSSRAGLNAGFEIGKQRGVFFSASFGGVLGIKSKGDLETFYFNSNIGYNIKTMIPGVTLQPSIGWSDVIVSTWLTSIPQNKSDILVFNETVRYKPSCGCKAKETNVIVHNSSSFAQFKFAVKYDFNPYIALSIGATYYAPLRSRMILSVVNINDSYRRHGYTDQSVAAAQNDNIGNAPIPLYGEATLLFRFKPRKRSLNYQHHHSHVHTIVHVGCH